MPTSCNRSKIHLKVNTQKRTETVNNFLRESKQKEKTHKKQRLKMADAWRKKTVVQLKAELVKRGGTTRGKKEDLIKRIIAFDNNNNFQSDPILIPDDTPMPQWPS